MSTWLEVAVGVQPYPTRLFNTLSAAQLDLVVLGADQNVDHLEAIGAANFISPLSLKQAWDGVVAGLKGLLSG